MKPPDRIEIRKDGDHFFLDGKEVTEAQYHARHPKPQPGRGVPGGHALGCWPQKSDALGCHPDDRTKFMEDAQKKGVPTDFDGEGFAVFRDRNHRKRYAEAYGFYDRDGGYGDPGKH